MRRVQDFHRRETTSGATLAPTSIHEGRGTPRLARVFARAGPAAAPKLVTGLWTSCTRLKTGVVTKSDFRLTIFIEGVEQDLSLTSSCVFPVGAASVARAKSLSDRKVGWRASKGL